MAEESELALRLHNASLAIKEIRSGNASGCLPSLYGRAAIETTFEYLGKLITAWSPIVAAILLGVVVLVFGLCCVGFVESELETEVAELWVETGGRLDNEIDYTDAHLDEDFSTTQELIIQLVRSGNFSASLHDHLQIMRAIVEFNFTYDNITITFRDLCAAGRLPRTRTLELNRVAREAVPCVVITPLDCFWEGSILQFPEQFIEPVNASGCPRDGPMSPSGINGDVTGVTWGNIDFDILSTCLSASPESGYTPFLNVTLQAANITGYVNKRCFSSLECPPTNQVSPQPEAELTNDGCRAFSSLIVEPRSLLIDGYEGEVPQAMRSAIVLEGPGTLEENFRTYRNVEFTRDQTNEILTIWKETFFQLVIDYNNGHTVLVDAQTDFMDFKSTNDEIFGWTSDTVENVSEEYSDVEPVLILVGYILMISYCGLAFLYFNWVNSHVSVGLVGLLLVALASAAALGLTAALGVDFNITTTQIFPFLVLGVGVDDMFVIGDAFFEIEHHMGRGVGIKALLSTTLRVVGPSITLTSITNAAGFFLSAVIPIPAIRNFAIQVGLAVVFNYFALLIGLSSFIVLDYYRVKVRLVDFFCCIPGFLCCCCNNDKDTAEIHKQDTKPKRAEAEEGSNVVTNLMNRFKQYRSPVTALVVDFYSPFLQNYIVKAVVIVICSIWFGFAVWGCTRVEDGLDLDDVLPEGTVEHSFASANVRHFAAYQFTVITKDINYADPEVQMALLRMSDDIGRADHVVLAGGLTANWLQLATNFYFGLQQFYIRGYCPGLTRLISLNLPPQQLQIAINTTFGDFLDVFGLVHTTVDLLNLNDAAMVGQLIATCNLTFLPELVNYTTNRIPFIPEERFYRYIALWTVLDSIQYELTSPSFNPRPPEAQLSNRTQVGILIRDAISYGPILYAEQSFFSEGLADTPDFENLINGVRGILESYERYGIYSYPNGPPFLFWEQYINLRRNVGLACGLILAACFVATMFFLMDLWSAILLVCMLALISSEVFGVAGFLEIKFSSIPAIMIIASVGVAVEFTAPLTFYFLKASPEPGEKKLSFFGLFDLPKFIAHWLVTRNERMHKALEHRFTPVFNGSVTTFLGIIMLAFATLPFIRLYFFAILLSIVLLGVLNGLVLLPVLLSLVGPPAQAYPSEKEETNGIPLEARNAGYVEKQNSVLY